MMYRATMSTSNSIYLVAALLLIDALIPVMHPKIKTDYFCRMEWPSNWIDAAIKYVRTVWETHYRKEAAVCRDKDESPVHITMSFILAFY